MEEEKAREAVKKAAKSGKLSCKKALDLAAKLGCDTALVGRIANEEKIKIVKCSLGCF